MDGGLENYVNYAGGPPPPPHTTSYSLQGTNAWYFVWRWPQPQPGLDLDTGRELRNDKAKFYRQKGWITASNGNRKWRRCELTWHRLDTKLRQWFPLAISREIQLQFLENKTKSGWWFGTWILFFHSVGNNHPSWRTHIFQRGRYTANQKWLSNHHPGFHRPAMPRSNTRRKWERCTWWEPSAIPRDARVGRRSVEHVLFFLTLW